MIHPAAITPLLVLLGALCAVLGLWCWRLSGLCCVLARNLREAELTQGRLLAVTMRHAARLYRLEHDHADHGPLEE